VAPRSVCALTSLQGTPCLFDLSSLTLAHDVRRGCHTLIGLILEKHAPEQQSSSAELLALLRKLALNGPIKAVGKGDTAVGRSIETALGIKINSSKKPDYKGIEIKSGRAPLTGRETRKNLFACVPDWNISHLKSSRAILEFYGYRRGGNHKLYCTVTTRRANSRGLLLCVDEAERLLNEVCRCKAAVQDVCSWRLEKLHDRLLEKHAETFWISATEERIRGGVWFRLKSVMHTSSPSTYQFDRLLIDSGITVDHLIKREPGSHVKEKGPLFKLEHHRIGELFMGVPRHHSLL